MLLKPGQVLRLTKKGKLPESIQGGHPKCLKCETVEFKFDTSSPTFWENGSYCYCDICKQVTLHGAVYPAIENFPDGIEIDTRGERKKYDLTVDFQQSKVSVVGPQNNLL